MKIAKAAATLSLIAGFTFGCSSGNGRTEGKVLTEPQVRIGIVQKATGADISFPGGYEMAKASAPEKTLRSAGPESLKVDLVKLNLNSALNRLRVSLGHFRSYEQTEYLLKKLGEVPFEHMIAQPKQWSIWFGPFTNKAEAEHAMNYIRAKGLYDVRIEPVSDAASIFVVRTTDGSELAKGGNPLVFRPVSGGFKINSKEYKGDLELRLDQYGTLSAINIVNVEDYIASVLPKEMPPSAHPEALKAQAVIARTYLMNNLGRHEADGFNLCATTDCQVYGGVNDVTASTLDATKKTRGMVLTYSGRLANAVFHSTCGGVNANYDDVFSGGGHPYLTSVDDGSGVGDVNLDSAEKVKAFLARKAGFCEASKYFRWEKSYGKDELLELFKQTIPEFSNKPDLKINDFSGIKIIGYFNSGRVKGVSIDTDAGRYVFEKDAVRWVFGGLKSTLFVLEVGGTAQAPVYTFKGAGWGHGLGLCQMGAMNMAKQGYGMNQILSHYYPGATVEAKW